MDIERMKKINSMIPELKKQGFAKNSSEAALQSDALFKNMDEESIIQGIHAAISTATVQKGHDHLSNEQEQVRMAGTGVSSVSSEQVTLLEKRINVLEQDLTSVISKMNEMIGVIIQLESLKTQMAAQKEREHQQTIDGKPAQAAKKQEKEKQEAPKKEAHARSGNYTSADVDINKIFYFGSK